MRAKTIMAVIVNKDNTVTPSSINVFRGNFVVEEVSRPGLWPEEDMLETPPLVSPP